MFEVDLAEEYTSELQRIGESFMRYFEKRSNTLPLHIQIACGLLSVPQLEEILKKKPYLAGVHDDFGRVPLMMKCHSAYYRTLLKYGADPNASDNAGNNVVMYQRKHPDLIKELVAAGAKINANNNEGVSLMLMTLLCGGLIRPLLDLGATMPRPEKIPRDKADFVFLCRLLHEPLDVLSKIFDLCSPSNDAYLEAKIKLGTYDQQKYEWLKTQEHRYPVQRKKSFSDYEERRFISSLSSRARNEGVEQVKELVANMEECLEDRSSVLNCIRKGKEILKGVQNPDMLEFLLNAGADPNLGKAWKEDTDEETPLYQAVCRHDLKSVKLLLNHGADPNTGTTDMDRDDTCVSRAILDNELEILQVLINAKADLNFAIRCDRTPIITAIRCNNLPALKLLVEGGADPCLVDQYGRTPEGYLSNDTSPELCGYFKPVVTMHSKKKSST